MKRDVYIGIDMGSTGLKVVAFEERTGKTLASAGEALPFQRLSGGGCELEAAAIEGALMRSLRSVADQLGERRSAVRALSATGHGAGLYALDRHRALLRGRAVASTDQRASARARALGARDGSFLFQEVGSRPWPGQPALLVAELLGADAVQRGALRHLLFAKDYLGLLLTGEIATESSDASTAGLISLASGSWSTAACDAAGVPDLAAALPPLVRRDTVLGPLLAERAADCGLPAGVPVAVSGIDLLASLDAVGAPERGLAVAVLGTWCVNAVVAPVRDDPPAVGGIVHLGGGERRLYLENSPSSMANVSWLARTLGFDSAAEVVDCAFSVPLGAGGLRFLPFINGGAAPEGASAGFLGLQSHHGRAEMARAVVDAVAALHAQHLARLASFGLGLPREVAALGGGARDLRLVRLIASFLDHPLLRCGDDETGARGAALAAARSQGAWLAAPPFEIVTPEPADSALHAAFYAEFGALVDSMSPAFDRLAGSQA